MLENSGDEEENPNISVTPLKKFDRSLKNCLSSTQMTKPTAVEVGSKTGNDFSSSFVGSGSRHGSRP